MRARAFWFCLGLLVFCELAQDLDDEDDNGEDVAQNIESTESTTVQFI